MLVAADQEALRPNAGGHRNQERTPASAQSNVVSTGPGFDVGQRGPHAVVDALSDSEMTAWGPAGEVDDIGILELGGIPVRRD